MKVWLFNSININYYILQLQVVLQKCKVKSLMHSPGDYILLSADKYEIKVCTIYHVGTQGNKMLECFAEVYK